MPEFVVDKFDWKLFQTKFKSIMPEAIRIGLLEAMQFIGLKAVEGMPVRDFDATSGKIGQRIAGEKLNIMSGRLKSSLLNQPSPMEGQMEGIRRAVRVANEIIGYMGSTVPYAAIHEFGGTTGRGGSTIIPPRPYLQPAVEESEEHIYRMLKLKLELSIREADI